jgi:hypothetical protein
MKGRADVGGSHTELLETFQRLGYISSEAVQALKGRAASQRIALVEAALLENLLDPDAKGWLLAERLGIPFLRIAGGEAGAPAPGGFLLGGPVRA